MKKSYIACIFLLIANSSFSQLNRNQFLVGGLGDFSYSNQNTKLGSYNQNNKLTAFSISADGGYFIIDRLCAGLRFTGSLNNLSQQSTNINYGFATGGNLVTDTVYTLTRTKYISKIHSYGFSPFIRYYFFAATHKINIVAEANYTHSFDASGYNSITESFSYQSGTPPPVITSGTNVSLKTTQSNAVGIHAGPAIFFNPKVSIEMLLGWQYLTSTHLTTNSFTLGVGFHAYLNKL